MSFYRHQPPPIAFQKQSGPLSQFGNFAMKKGLQAGINAAIPGGGFAAEAAQEVLPGMIPYFNSGGPLGGGQTKEGLIEARQLGALTQAEFLKAMAHAGYMNEGGKVKQGPLASMTYKSEKGETWERKFHDPSKPKPAAGGSSSKEK